MRRINRTLITALVFGALSFCAGRAMAADTDTIDTVSEDGEHIVMQSGQTYQSGDPGTSASWQSGDDVVITDDDTIINKDENGETVDGSEE